MTVMSISFEKICQRIDQYEKLMRLDKPIGILLLLWPTWWALWLSAKGLPDWRVWWIFTLGTVLMRSAGCVINDLVDRKFDPHVERTRALLHLVTLDPGEGRDPVADYDALKKELRTFDPELAKRPTIVALAKADLPEVKEAYPELRARFAKKKIKLHLVSAATHEGMKELVQRLYELVLEGRREAALAAKKA
jgi:hypothetical protein